MINNAIQPWCGPDKGWNDLEDERLNALLACLQDHLQSELGHRAGVLFSGGLDSALLTALAKPLSTLALYTVGYPQSHDMMAGCEAAKALGIPWKGLTLDDETVRHGVASLRSMGVNDPVTASFELPLFVVCSRVPEQVLLSGQGADELFGGYARYASMGGEERRRAMDADIADLLNVGAVRERRMAEGFGKRLACPYLSPDVIRLSRSFSSEELIGPSGNKLPLRNLALCMGLSSASAPKKAAQYGSGIMAAMKRMAAGEGQTVGRWAREVEG